MKLTIQIINYNIFCLLQEPREGSCEGCHSRDSSLWCRRGVRARGFDRAEEYTESDQMPRSVIQTGKEL
jgi:hypothetical protein